MFKKIAMMGACVLALAACDQRPNVGDGTGGGFNTGVGSGGPNDPNNPRSVAFFNQTIGDRVLFAVDQSTLSPEALVVLDGQANWLLTNTDYTATIEGHADEQGTREYNLALGARRASAVQDYLVSKGIAANRIDIVTYGKERPLEICSTEACWSKNRRAVTLVAAGLTN